MKKNLLLLVAISLLITLTNSCKKGEEDPFFSFKTRKARLIGDWTMFEGVAKSGSSVVNYDGVNAISGSQTWLYSQTMKFNGDGTYECNTESNNYQEKCIKKGTWAFGPKDKAMDLKAKEYLVLRIKDLTYYLADTAGLYEMNEVYTDDACPTEVLRLKELRSKQITVEMDGTSQYRYGNYDTAVVESYEKLFERSN